MESWLIVNPVSFRRLRSSSCICLYLVYVFSMLSASRDYKEHNFFSIIALIWMYSENCIFSRKVNICLHISFQVYNQVSEISIFLGVSANCLPDECINTTVKLKIKSNEKMTNWILLCFHVLEYTQEILIHIATI